MTINKVIIIGNLGQDPEIRKTQDGREIANFSLATSEKWFDKSTGEKKEKTEWHKISVFSQGLVDIIKQYVKKGSKLYIEGALQTRKWKDGNGIEKYSTEIVLQNYNSTLQILNSSEKEIDKHSIEKGNGYAPQAEDFNDEIPF
jgi:single-strand DNA-binding protein